MFTLDPETDALLVIDVQNDFCPGGTPAVPGGNEVVPLSDRLALLLLSPTCSPHGTGITRSPRSIRGRTHTGRSGYLRDRGLTRVVLVDLATDFCVAWSAQDAHE